MPQPLPRFSARDSEKQSPSRALCMLHPPQESVREFGQGMLPLQAGTRRTRLVGWTLIALRGITCWCGESPYILRPRSLSLRERISARLAQSVGLGQSLPPYYIIA